MFLFFYIVFLDWINWFVRFVFVLRFGNVTFVCENLSFEINLRNYRVLFIIFICRVLFLIIGFF